MSKRSKTPPQKEEAEIDTLPLNVEVGDQLSSRIDGHIKSLKLLKGQKPNKGSWLREAVQEKLKNERNLSLEGIPQRKVLSIRLDTKLTEELEDRIKLIRKFHNGYTKKRWVVSAILEKLEREESNAKELLKKMLNSSQGAS